MMGIHRACWGCLALFVAITPAGAATKFIANLEGGQEVGPVVTDAAGSATLMLNDLGGGNFSLDYSVTINDEINFINYAAGLDNGTNNNATGFHIHAAPRGVNAGVVYGIFGPDHDNDNDVTAVLNGDNSTTFTGSWGALDGNPVGNINTFGPGLLAAGLGDVGFYFNVHTPGNSGGEIRGQLVAVPEPGAIGLLGAAVGCLLLWRRRR